MLHLKKWTFLVSLSPIFLIGCLSENNATDPLYLSDLGFAKATVPSTQAKIFNPTGSFEDYRGNKQAAILDKANTLKFVDLLYPTVSFANKPYSQTSANTSGEVSGFIKHQRAIIAATLAQTVSDPASRLDSGVYDFKHCLYKGTSQQQATQGKAGTTYTLTNCQQFQNISLDGEVNLLNQEASNQQLNSYKLSFKNLTIHDDNKTYHYSGTINTYRSEGTQTIEANVQGIDLVANTQQYLKDLVWIDGQNDHIEGQLYDNENGFVELRSSEDLVLDNDGIPTKGRLYLLGKDYGDAFLGKPKDNYYGSIHIEIDEEGDGFNEFRISKNVIYKTTSIDYATR